MSRARILALAGATALLSTATFAALSTETLAADLPPPLPPPVYRPAVVEASGWYLRGFVGMSNQFLSDIHHPSFDTAPQFTFLDKGGFESGIFVGGGIGYAWNNWLRFDVTGEYRGKVGFSALDRYFNDPNFFTNDYRATKSEWVVLVNGYFDLGTWWCVTPFIGAGVGVAQNRIEHFRDTNVIAGGGGWADARDQEQPRLGPVCRRVLQGDVEFRHRSILSLPEPRQGRDRSAGEPRSHLLQRQSIEPGDVQQHPVA